MPEMVERPSRVDVLTLIAIAIVAYAITNVSHEGLGHGGACIAVGGTPIELNAVYFRCDNEDLGARVRWVPAAGTIVNLVFGAIFGLAARFSGPKATPGRYFLWLVMTLSFLQATGYWLFSGLGGIGDWAKVTEGLAPAWLFRILLAAIGGAGYYATIVFALTTLRPFVDGAEDRIALARKLTVIPYLAGGILYVVAGFFNPVSVEIVLTSAAAASFGGASALAWMYKMLRDPKQPPPKSAPPVAIERSWPWIAAGSIVAAVFIVVLGRSITFRAP